MVKKKHIVLLVIFGILIWYYKSLPGQLFNESYSIVVFDRDSTLLSAQVAKDGQWRFPPVSRVSKEFEKCILTFEDQRFYSHLGVDPISVFQAFFQNINEGKIVRGASTINMQIMRMSMKNHDRSWWNKIIESILATRIDFSYSKEELLALYASHAPFGGNVVGVEAASWRYFKKPSNLLSWAENATLAVLPNAPGLIHPGRNKEALKKKRDFLLKKLLSESIIDSMEYRLAILESIPEKPYPIDQLAPHLMHRSGQSNNITTIDIETQSLVNRISEQHRISLHPSGVDNMAVIVLDTKTKEVLAYFGNHSGSRNGCQIDMIRRKRSTGSLLKPLLYASCLDGGLINPKELLKDIPTYIDGFHPENYHKTYYGAVPANQALIESLNVPFVHLLRRYGIQRFIHKLNAIGIQDINRSSEFYGLSLILGGGEASLWQLTNAFASMGKVLLDFNEHQGKYDSKAFDPPTLYQKSEKGNPVSWSFNQNEISVGAVHHTLETLSELNRPDQEGQWLSFSSSKKMAWKTGTSFGHRDAWAIGVAPNYTIGVWVGNADNKPVYGLTGIKVAAPILFDIANSLPNVSWFDIPFDDLKLKVNCGRSGLIASDYCPRLDTTWTATNVESRICEYHKNVNLDEDEKMRVNHTCYSINGMKQKVFFVMPSEQAVYYRKYHSDFEAIPEFKPDCKFDGDQGISIIYPPQNANIFVPRGLDNKREDVVFKGDHVNPKMPLHWYIDEQYIGKTLLFHSIKVKTNRGIHILKVVDGNGQSVVREFTVKYD